MASVVDSERFARLNVRASQGTLAVLRPGRS
jgi:hypothetical protein